MEDYDAVFVVKQDEDGGAWTLISLDPSQIPTSVLNSGNQLGSFESPDAMCREIGTHVQKLQATRSEKQRSGGEGQRV